MSGQVFLSGVVASEQDKQIIENEVRNTPGVSQVYSDLHVATQPTSETPPPPPQPVLRPDVEVEAGPHHHRRHHSQPGLKRQAMPRRRFSLRLLDQMPSRPDA